MKKLLIFTTVLYLALFAGCVNQSQNSATVFALDTVVNIKANADMGTLNGALSLCRKYEKIFSRTDAEAEITLLNQKGSGTLSDDALAVLEKALEYCQKTDGKFDITIGSVSRLWDFNSNTLPDDKAIKNALPLVDYKKIIIIDNFINLNGAQIDLGAVAKGYIADRTAEYLREQGVSTATINLGGNITVMGEDYQKIAIKDPLSNGNKATLKLKNTSVSTAGVYERYIQSGNKRYHHILDTKTGYAAETNVVSASVVCENSCLADILSTCCVLYGLDGALNLINSTEGVEAVIITNDGEIHLSNGIYCENGYYLL